MRRGGGCWGPGFISTNSIVAFLHNEYLDYGRAKLPALSGGLTDCVCVSVCVYVCLYVCM